MTPSPYLLSDDRLATDRIRPRRRYNGATLARPGLDRLRDAVKDRKVDGVLATAPDRLAPNDVFGTALP